MLKLPMEVGDCRLSASTASAALINGWISSIRMLGSCAGGTGHGCIFSEHVLYDFVQYFRLDRLLYKVPRAALQCCNDVVLVTDRRHHHDAGIRVRTHDALGRLNAFHLRHGDIHEHDVRISAVVFGDCGAAIAGFARYLPAERLDHAGQVLTREDGVVNYQVADGLPIFTFYWCELLHNEPPHCSYLQSLQNL